MTQLKTNLTQVQLDQLAKLVSFKEDEDGVLTINDINGDVRGDVRGDVVGDVYGDIYGDAHGNVLGNVSGYVSGFVEDGVKGNVFIRPLLWWAKSELTK